MPARISPPSRRARRRRLPHHLDQSRQSRHHRPGRGPGATITVNGGKTWSSWYNQPTAQFYHVITDNQFPYWVYGGQQESGSIGTASRSDFGEITFRDWTTVGVEEYGYVAPDPLHPNLIYGGKATVFDRNTGQTRDVSPVVLRTGQYRFNRTAPLVFSQVDPHFSPLIRTRSI